MRKTIIAVMVLVLVLSFSGCCVNVGEKLTSYTATFTIYGSNDVSPSASGELGTDCFSMATTQSLIKTYAQIIKSNRVLEPVAEELNNGLTASQIREMLSVEPVEDTSVLKISVTSNDYQAALDIAKAIANVAPDVISNVLEGSRVMIIDNPEVTEETSLRNLFR